MMTLREQLLAARPPEIESIEGMKPDAAKILVFLRKQKKAGCIIDDICVALGFSKSKVRDLAQPLIKSGRIHIARDPKDRVRFKWAYVDEKDLRKKG